MSKIAYMQDKNNNCNFNMALDLLNEGISVVPLDRNMDLYIDDFDNYTTKIAGNKKLKKWWTMKPESNVGLITGEISEIIVVVFNINDGGFKIINNKKLPETFYKSDGVNYYYFFKYPEQIKEVESFKKVDNGLKGMSVKGDNDYIPYLFDEGINKDDLKEMPEWLLDLIQDRSICFNDKNFIPKNIARKILEIEKKKNRPWEYISEHYKFYNYKNGIWKVKNNEYLKSLISGYLEKINIGWDKSNKINEIINAIKRILTEEGKMKKFSIKNNRNLSLINLKNGVLNIENDELEEHDPKHYFTTQFPVEYDSDAEFDLWEEKLKEWVPNKKDRLFLQEFIGYCLTFDVSRHKAVILYGEGSNGKSTFLNVISELFGSKNLSSSSLRRLSENKYEAASLENKLVNICHDIDSIPIKRVGILKNIIHGNGIKIEEKYKKTYESTLPTRLMFSANELPRSIDTTSGWFRSFEIIHFPNEFTPNQKKWDKDLDRKLCNELQGILNWALNGLKRLNKNNHFTISDNMIDNKNKYKYTHCSDAVSLFIQEKIIKDEESKVKTTDLYNQFKLFCKSIDIDEEDIIKKQTFGKKMSDKGYKSKTKYLKSEQSNQRCYIGLKLKK